MIRVTCAIIRNEEERVLVVQRGRGTDHPMKWEFPGGKVNAGETDEDCIIREIEEELSMDIVICSRLNEVIYSYSSKTIQLVPFICDTLDESPVLHEHVDFKWIFPEQLSSVDFSEADIEVAAQYKGSSVLITNHDTKDVSDAEEDQVVENEFQQTVNSLTGTEQADWLATSAVENSAIIARLIRFSLSENERLAFKASWTLTKVSDKSPDLLNPFIDQIISALSSTKNESVLRSFLRIVSFVDPSGINNGLHGILADYCFLMLRTPDSAVAVKVYAMEILYKLTSIYPEITNELAGAISILMDEKSAALLSRGRSILRRLS